MNTRWLVAACALALAACGGGAKQADSPGTCPEGTVLQGSDCVPDEGSGGSSGSASRQHKSEEQQEAQMAAGGSGGGGADVTSSGKAPYDKDAVEAELKRAARQIKANCGAATDEDGKATGPWGATRANVVLGRNGHVKQVTVPAPYDGKPVGDCVVHAFEKIQFPPYAGSSDVSVEWDVDIVPPKHH